VRLKEIAGFELLNKIGQGGMGTVFRAQQKSLDRVVALKVLPPSIAKDQKFIERFQREARASAKLNHPNIVQGIDVGLDPSTGLWYFAMEYIDGPNVAAVLKQQRVLPEEQVLSIGRDVARALECSWGAGIVHRDIKPDNILISAQGETKLADLGLAKQTHDDAGVTQSGQAIGTPFYMAPEQVRGKSDEIDIRTDIYALGATLFQMATGRPPYDGETSAVIMSKHLTEPVPKARQANPALSEGFSRLVERMMQKKREQRVQTPAELLSEIEKVLRGEILRDSTTGPRRPVAGTMSARRREAPTQPSGGGKLAVVALAMLLIGAAAAFVIMQGKKPDERVADAKAQTESKKDSAATGTKAIPGEPKSASVEPKAGQPQLKVPPPPLKTAQPKATTKAAPKFVGDVNAAVDIIIDRASETPGTETVEKPATKQATAENKSGDTALAKKEIEPKSDPDVKAPAKKDADPKPVPDVKAVVPEKTEAPRPAPAVGVQGSGFLGEYFQGQSFETLITSQNDTAIDFKWSKGIPDLKIEAGISVRWTGLVEPVETGTYVFDVTSHAGSRLYLDGQPIFDSWSGKGNIGKSFPVNLTAKKKYAVKFEVRNKGSDYATVAALKWGPVGGPMVPVSADGPESVKDEKLLGHLTGGWHAEYGPWDKEALVKRTEPFICWDWHTSSPAIEVPRAKFWGTWAGLVVPPETDDYTFTLDSDDGARLFINEMLILDFANLRAGKYVSAPLRLEKGKRYLMKVDYHQYDDYASCSLRWSSKAISNALVPAVGTGVPDEALPPDGFFVEYGSWASGKAILSRRELQAGWDWHSGSPHPDIPRSKFWAKYSGWITPPADGAYTFNVWYDDNILFFLDDVLILEGLNTRGPEAAMDLPPITLKGGKHYSVRIEYRQYDDYAHLVVKWKSPDMPLRILNGTIPESVKSGDKDIAHINCGMLAEYGLNKPALCKRLEGRLFHDFHSGTPSGEVTAGGFWGRWTAGLKVPANGPYVFRLDADLSAELKLRDLSVIKVPLPAPRTAKADTRPTFGDTAPLNLSTTQVEKLQVSYTAHRGEYSHVKLTWKPPGKTEFEDIPAECFVQPPGAREYVRMK
jgi:serine/threonine protein kinase